MKIESCNKTNINEEVIIEWSNKFKKVFEEEIVLSNKFNFDLFDSKTKFTVIFAEKDPFGTYKRIDIDTLNQKIKNKFPNAKDYFYEQFNNREIHMINRLNSKELLMNGTSINYEEVCQCIDKLVDESKITKYDLSIVVSIPALKFIQIFLYDKSIKIFSDENHIDILKAYEIAYVESLFEHYYKIFIDYFNPKKKYVALTPHKSYYKIAHESLKYYFLYKYLEKYENDKTTLKKLKYFLNDNYILNGELELLEIPYQGALELIEIGSASSGIISKINHCLKNSDVLKATEELFAWKYYFVAKLLHKMEDDIKNII